MKDVFDIRASVISVFARGTVAFAALAMAVALLCAPSLAYAENDPIAPFSDDDIAQAVVDEGDVEDATVEQVAIVDASAQDDSPTDQAATDDSGMVETDSNTTDSTFESDGDESTPTPAEHADAAGTDSADPEPAIYEEIADEAETYPTEDEGAEVSDDDAEQAASVGFDLAESENKADAAKALEATERDLPAEARSAEAGGAKAALSDDAKPVTTSPTPSEKTATAEMPETGGKAETPKKATFNKREALTKKAAGNRTFADKDPVSSTTDETYSVFYESAPAIPADGEHGSQGDDDPDHHPIDPTSPTPATPAEPVAPPPSTSSTICCSNGSPSGAHAAAFIETTVQPGGIRASSTPESAAARTFGPHKGPARCRSPSLC